MILACHHISKEYPENTVLRDVTFHLERGDKAAVVGINGAGKTTLLRIIVGEESADDGSVSFERDCSFGYLAQNQGLDSERTVYEEALSVKHYLIDMESRLTDFEIQMENLKGDSLTQTISEYTDLLHRFKRENGYAYRGEVTGVLRGLGFTQEEFDQKAAAYDERFRKADAKLNRLKAEKQDRLMRVCSVKKYVENLRGQAGPIDVWNEQAWCLLVTQVTVHADGSAEFLFRGENRIMVK
jgi:ATP-binding cassette subfamily F protein 3